MAKSAKDESMERAFPFREKPRLDDSDQINEDVILHNKGGRFDAMLKDTTKTKGQLEARKLLAKRKLLIKDQF